MPRIDRRRTQITLRLAALTFVLAWIFSRSLQGLVPYQVPFAVLLVTEAEFLVRSVRERRAPGPASGQERTNRLPGRDDADLGWGELVEVGDDVVYVPPPVRPRRRRGARLLTVMGIAAGVVLFALAARADRARTWDSLPAATRTRAERLFTREAARIAARPVTVRCDAGYDYTGIGSDALGVAFPRRALAFIEPHLCRSLADLALRRDRPGDDDTTDAVLVLAHEAVHLGGESNEGVTECRALQEGVALGVRLGLSEELARRLMAARYRRMLAERSITRLSYQLPASCRNGAELDQHPRDERFP